MLILQSMPPCQALRMYVRAYAQRKTQIADVPIFEPVPARLEQTLEFQFGDLYDVCFSGGLQLLSPPIVVVGLQTQLRADIRLYGQIESFAVFFQPSGFSQLFGIPMVKFLNQAYEATSVYGSDLRAIWNRLGESSSFTDRVSIIERFLLRLAACAPVTDSIAVSANRFLALRGIVSVSALAGQSGLSLRHFERRFFEGVGLPPKRFARIARFQTALDAKVANPDLTWLHIAHDLDYFDQMHMVHDFQKLGGDSPSRVLARLGDLRPEALASSGVESLQTRL
ncbi:MAG: helix-turn-helix domain-containing protein [Silvibacterium sp.]